jgi:hypothetical protein
MAYSFYLAVVNLYTYTSMRTCGLFLHQRHFAQRVRELVAVADSKAVGVVQRQCRVENVLFNQVSRRQTLGAHHREL